MNDKVNEFRRNMILDTAGEYFKKFGYDKTSIDKISKELSIGVGTIYSYFTNKEGLFYAWVESVIDSAKLELYAKEGLTPREQLQWYIDYRIDYYVKNKASLRDYILGNGFSKNSKNPFSKAYEYVAERLSEFGNTNLDTQLLAHILDDILNSYIEHYKEKVVEKREEIIEMFLRVIYDKK